MNTEMKETCKKFMKNAFEVTVDEEKKLTLHGLTQYFVELKEDEKTKLLLKLLDEVNFNQIIIFVSKVARCKALTGVLIEQGFPAIGIHRGLVQKERLDKYKDFKEGKARVLVATDLFGRGIDIERVNVVVNYDMTDTSDSYLHRVGRAGRCETKGVSVTFVASDEDKKVLKEVQERFEVEIGTLPEAIDQSTYSEDLNSELKRKTLNLLAG